MTDHAFATPRPVTLHVENGRGSVAVHAADTTESRVGLSGHGADQVEVTFDDGHLRVVSPQQRLGFLSGDQRLDVVVTVPTGSALTTKLGSADLTTHGELGTCRVRSGSGDVVLEHVDGDSTVETGSGTVHVDRADRPLRVKSGSGDVRVDRAHDELSVSTGSGDVTVGGGDGPTVVKTGSGGLVVRRAGGDVTLTTGSGDLLVEQITRGRVAVKGASGDVRVGVPAGTPVWTDLSTLSGRIRSTIESAGPPEPGADHVELHATTVSGDIELTQT